jgi:hypothetical protein
MGAQSLVQQGYKGYQGWGDAEAEADFKATGGAGKGGPSSSGGGSGFSSVNPQDTIRAAIDAMKEANKPAVESLQASIPETSAKYAGATQRLVGSKAPLEQRYQQILDSIKGNQQVAENRQTLTTNNELGKRGISGSSGVAQQEITNAVNPITQQYTGLQKETSLAREEGLRGIDDQIANMTSQETADLRAIQNMIAQLSSGAGQSGLSAGMNLYSTNLQAQQAEQQRQDNLKQQDIANKLAQAQQSSKNTAVIEVGGRTKLIDTQTGQVIQDLGITKLQSQVGGGW